MDCILCHSSAVSSFGIFDGKQYWTCGHCAAKFLDKRHFLTQDAERKHYLNHQNLVADPDYRQFLDRLKKPLEKQLSPGATGLDYGCGSGPALADMFRADGFDIDLYDPFFFPDETIFNRQYDFITCTETAEHFYDPCSEFATLDRLLKPGGKLGLMTCFATDDNAFEKWHYRRDPTHVVFYKERTFQVIAAQYQWRCNVPAKDIVIMTKP